MCADAPDVPPVEPPEGVECLESLFRGTPAGICVLDTELRYLYVNPALEEMHGIPAAEHLGRTVEDILPELNVPTDLLRGALADGRAREVASSGRTPSSDHPGLRFWQGACHRVEQDGEVRGLVLIMLEVLAPRRRHVEYERVSRHLTMLDTATNRIGTTLDMNTTCRELAEFVVPELADVASVEVSVPEIGHPVRPPPAGVVRLRRAGMAAVPGLAEAVRQFGEPGQYADYQDGGAIPVCLETNQPVVQNLSTDAQLTASAPSPERVAVYRALGFHSVCIVPLTSRGRPLGCLALVRAGDSPAFTDQDVAVARELAVRAAVDLDHARRYTREHGIALELQRALLSEPREPHPHIEVATRYLPVGQGAEVGGDWFDVVPLSDARHLKVMGDVMGHGVEAAVAMSHYRSMVRLLAQDELPPHVILERLDLMVEKAGIDRAATCLLAVVDRFRGECQVASAGHLPPVFIDRGAGAVIAGIPVGPPLGTGLGGYRTASLPCGPGTVLFMYTDGLVERRDEDIDVSVNRLADLRLPVGGTLEGLLDEVLDRFGRDATDDIAVLASRIRSGRTQGVSEK
ncbi:SpoIIE family protein phosphatase [Streptomyces sp. NBC_00963]|uniref:SpoIIE family protein phosphatase n=1 Tax=Streptomyces sp. NBC_00963 TaxID=2903697 RepID=UPI003866B1B2|nr:SpoIIE family protein phosphatase [Streptomyces sp. NBC_00963]